MQTVDFAATLDLIVTELRLDEVDTWLVQFFGEPASTSNQLISAEAKAKFEQLVFTMSNRASALQDDQTFGQILLTFGLAPALSASNLAALISLVRSSPDSATLVHTSPDKMRIWELFYTIRAFLRARKAVNELLVAPKQVITDADSSLVQLDLIDHDGRGLTLVQLRAHLESLQRLADAIATALGVEDKPRVAYTDSGSDIGLGVLAKTGVAEAIAALFRDGLRHLRFWKADGFDRKLESLENGLSFLDGIHARIKSGNLDAGIGAKVERAILKEMSGLLGSGVKLHEDVEMIFSDDRTFLVEGTRPGLLGPGPGTTSQDDS